jgi:FAD/FMN-containing dehydrogenase
MATWISNLTAAVRAAAVAFIRDNQTDQTLATVRVLTCGPWEAPDTSRDGHGDPGAAVAVRRWSNGHLAAMVCERSWYYSWEAFDPWHPRAVIGRMRRIDYTGRVTIDDQKRDADACLAAFCATDYPNENR